jgi:hypothetical protein
MEIRPLPKKQNVTFFEVQYFHNAGKQGTAKHVLLVTYSTEPDRFRAKHDKSVQHRVRFDLATDREIYRKAKKHLGEADAFALKQEIRRLKKDQDIITWFGLRQAHYATRHRYIKGKSFHTRELDPNNQVLVFIKPDNTFNVHFNWEGETISVVVTPHNGALSENQSLGVGYYTAATRDAELREHVTRLKQPKSSVPVDVPVEAATAMAVKDNAHNDDAPNAAVSGTEAISQVKTMHAQMQQLTMRPHRTNRAKQKNALSDQDVFDTICQRNAFTAPPGAHKLDLGTSIKLPL